MPDPRTATPPRRRRLLALATAAALLAGLGAVSSAPPASAAPGTGTGGAGQSLTVSTVDGLDPDGATVTVTGSGYDIAGFDLETEGMYLALCVDTGPSAAPSPCVGGVDMEGDGGGSRWVTNNPFDGAPAVPIGGDGTFTTTLTLQSSDDHVDCGKLPAGQSCKVVTRMDHRATGDRSQDVKVPVTFRGRSSSESFVVAAHVDFLGARPTPTRRNADVAALAGGQTRATYLRDLSTSDAYLSALVDKLYQDTLGRNGFPGEVAYWTGELRGRRTVARVAAEFYASREYYTGIGGGTDASWVRDLYEKVLLRTAGPNDVTYWVSEVRARGRGNVSLRIYQSPESAGTRVKGLYAALLGRAPSNGDLDYWRPIVVSRGDLSLAVFLANATEYSTRAVTRFP